MSFGSLQYPPWFDGEDWEDPQLSGLTKDHQCAQLAKQCAQLMRTVQEKEAARVRLSMEIADLNSRYQQESEAFRQQLSRYQKSQSVGAIAGPQLLADAWEEREEFCSRLIDDYRLKEKQCAELEEHCAKLDEKCTQLDEQCKKKGMEWKELAQSSLECETRCLELQEECKVRAHNQRLLEERCEELSRRCLEMQRRASSVIQSFFRQDLQLQSMKPGMDGSIAELVSAIDDAGTCHGELTTKYADLAKDLKSALGRAPVVDDYQELERRCQDETATNAVLERSYRAHQECRSELQECEWRCREEAERCQSLERLRFEDAEENKLYRCKDVEDDRASLKVLESHMREQHQECVAVKRQLFKQEEDYVALERTFHEEQQRCAEFQGEFQRQKLRCSHLVREFGETERHWSGRCAELEASLNARHRVAEDTSIRALSANLRAAEASVGEVTGTIQGIQTQHGLA